MTTDEKILKIDAILANSELVRMAEKHFDEESVEEMLFDLKKDLIELLETK